MSKTKINLKGPEEKRRQQRDRGFGQCGEGPCKTLARLLKGKRSSDGKKGKRRADNPLKTGAPLRKYPLI